MERGEKENKGVKLSTHTKASANRLRPFTDKGRRKGGEQGFGEDSTNEDRKITEDENS